MGRVNRRDFLKQSVFAGLGALDAKNRVTRATPKIRRQADNILRLHAVSSKKVLVGGAGISGLCCAYELMKKGHEVLVLEASGRHGGHVFTGRDGLSDGLYADFGADHITQPGYERFIEYCKEFDLKLIPYPNAEGSRAAPDPHGLRMIDGKFYTNLKLRDATTLRQLGFNENEIDFLSDNSWDALYSLYLKRYTENFRDSSEPFGNGYDDLDKISVADLYKKEGASATALRFLGGKDASALYRIWRLSIMYARKIPLSEGETFRINGGNQGITDSFARRLGDRLVLNHPIISLTQDKAGVTVTCHAYGRGETQIKADYFVNCITLPVFKNITLTPALSKEKQFVVDNLKYSSHPFFVFEARTKFWLEDGFQSINMEFEHPDIYSIWLEPNEVDTSRVILKAYGPSGLSPQRVLAAFRQLYPGKQDTIEQALTKDWSTDRFAPLCEMDPFPLGELKKFWPQILLPEGRFYFAGTYADAMSRGMESCIRSAQRVALEIDQA